MDYSELNGELIVISGPSGVGKSTLLKMLFEKYSDRVKFSISYTSRSPREGEKDGVDYFFVTKEIFEKKIKNNDFLEWAIVHDNYYGTDLKFVEDLVKAGYKCILDIDVQGAMTLKEKNIKAKYIFIAPKSIEDLKERLLKRGTDSLEVIEKRIRNSQKELTYKEKYDFVIINDNLDEAFKNLENAIFS